MSKKPLWHIDENRAIESPANLERSISERFLRIAEVQRRVPYSRSTIYAKIALGEFPGACGLGARAVAWLESDIDAWIASRVAKGRTLAPAPTVLSENQHQSAVTK